MSSSSFPLPHSEAFHDPQIRALGIEALFHALRGEFFDVAVGLAIRLRSSAAGDEPHLDQLLAELADHVPEGDHAQFELLLEEVHSGPPKRSRLVDRALRRHERRLLAEGDYRGLADSRLRRGVMATNNGDHQAAIDLFESARQWLLLIDQVGRAAVMLDEQAMALAAQGDLQRARDAHERALFEFVRAGARSSQALSLSARARLEAEDERPGDALWWMYLAIEVVDDLGDGPRQASFRADAGWWASELGSWALAGRLFAEAIEVDQHVPGSHGPESSLWLARTHLGLAGALSAQGVIEGALTETNLAMDLAGADGPLAATAADFRDQLLRARQHLREHP